MPFALHADNPPGRGEYLGDVRPAIGRAFGDPKAHPDGGVASRSGQPGNGGVVQRDQALRAGRRLSRSRQGHLREHCQLTARRCGIGQQPQMGREISRNITLLAPDRRQQAPHAPQRARISWPRQLPRPAPSP
jgi:hypothetical protein